MDSNNYLDQAPFLTVEQMMNKNFKALQLEDTLHTVIKYYHDYKISTLPVVDENDRLIGVFPKKRLFKALLDGESLQSFCKNFMVENPVFVMVDQAYDELSLIERVTKSPVDNVVVLDRSDKVVGMIGTVEYFGGSLNVIKSSSAMLESLFRANYEGMFILDNLGVILKINPAAEKMFQLEASMILGKSLYEIFPEMKLSDQLQLGIKKILRSLHVIINQVPIIENGKKVGSSLALLDVSHAEKIAEEFEVVKRLKTTIDGVLSASSDGVFVSDMDGIIKYVNERACRLLSKENEEIIGENIQNILPTTTSKSIPHCKLTEADYCEINGKKCIVSHIQIKQGESNNFDIAGMVSTVYLNDNVIAEEISRKWMFLNQQVQYYKDELEKRDNTNKSFNSIVTLNVDFLKIKNEARLIAKSSSTVLLTGESGVGKDMFAKEIHAASPRSHGPFIKVNSASIPETLFESELFGYSPGSFTGALKNGKPGYFERANNGTIFLDEIGDMPLSIQVKILQVLQEKEFTRVGGVRKQFVDVRIVAATNRDLREAIANKTFREDLFYRLNVIEFHLPPLRERVDDIIALADAFIKKYNFLLGASVSGISEEAQYVMLNYSWPGNVRELENAIERAANYVWKGEIGIGDLPMQINLQEHRPLEHIISIPGSIDYYQKELLVDAMNKTNGNKSAAARLLNLSRSAFYDRLIKYNLK